MTSTAPVRTEISPNAEALLAAIREKAGVEGFDVVGVTGARLPEGVGLGLDDFLADGRHGTMGWLEGRSDQRRSPDALWPDARSVICLGMNYGPDGDPMATLNDGRTGLISAYARNRDYHDIIKKRLKVIARWLVEETGCELKVFVDTAPVMEKPLAARAGLGWQGRHTNLVSRSFGSWLFLGEIYTTLDLPVSEAGADRCGSCTACEGACPTAALAGGKMDARRCISYLTIEHKGPIPAEFRAAMGNRIYGCDDCLAVCPWNKFASPTREEKLRARDDLTAPALADLLALDDGAFRALFSGSPIKRIGRDRFVRNVLIAAGNSGNRDLLPSVRALLDDEAAVVRGAAVWAFRRLANADDIAAMQAQYLADETEEEVRAEWS